MKKLLFLSCAIAVLCFATTLQAQPPNDDCANAIPVAVGSTTAGTTIGAGIDSEVPFCGTGVTSPGVWYSTVGTGNRLEVSTCEQADYDSKITVVCDDCMILTCVDGNDDGGGPCGLTSLVEVDTVAGAPYLILVHGFGGGTGNFDLSVTEVGPNVSTPVACSVPVATGACCYPEACADDQTEDDCVSQGGIYLGDDTICEDDSCMPVPTTPWPLILLLGTVLFIGVAWMLGKKGHSRRTVVGMMIVASLLLLSAAAVAADMTVEVDGQTYTITKDEPRYMISDESRTHVGHMTPLESGRQEVYAADGSFMGTAESLTAGVQMIHDSR